MRAPFLVTACLLAVVQGFGQTSNAPSQVIVWENAGLNLPGLTNVPLGLTNVVSVTAGNGYCIALNGNGTLAVWGDPNGGFGGTFPFSTDISNVIGLSTGNHYFFAVEADGTVVSVPGGSDPGCAMTSLTNVIDLSTVYCGQGIALLGSGSVVGVGTVEGGIDLSILPAGLSNAVAVSAGEYDFYALAPNGQVYAWGYVSTFNAGATNVPTGLHASAIAASGVGCLVLNSDGTVTNIGQNAPSPPAGLSNVIAISANDLDTGEMALKSDGTVVTWGDLPSPPPGLPYVQAISAGNGFCMALVNPTLSTSPPPILRNSPDQTVPAGSTPVEFVVTIGPVLGYQWYFDETNAIAGATNQLLFLPNVQVQQSGDYAVIVSNASGSTTSPPMALNVLPAASINMVPAITLYGGVGLNFEVQYINAIGPTNAPWNTLATVTLTNSPQFYSDYTSIGQPVRFYRIVQVP